jgi:hypothetical protein
MDHPSIFLEIDSHAGKSKFPTGGEKVEQLRTPKLTDEGVGRELPNWAYG